MKNKWLVNWGIFILLSLIWGSSFILMKESSRELNGWQIGGIRIFSAGFVFLPFALFHIFKIPRRKLPFIIISGMLGNLLPAFLFALAIEKVDSALEGILNSLTPLFVIVIGTLFFKTRLHPKKIAGVLISFIGLLILSFSKGGITITNYGSILMVLLATIFYGLNVNVVSHYLKEVDPMKMATISLAFMFPIAGAVLLYQNVFSIAYYDEGARGAIAYAVLLGVVGSAIATAFFYVLIKRAGGLFASLVTYAIPIVAILWGLLDNENITLIQLICLAIILGGVYISNRETKQP
ncbi:MAG TPA: DMT family transporter [Chitinophagaceae bacterium]|nr:DMT family transporter [Chitinophagaceae bacterium]